VTPLRVALHDYLRVRRSLGFKLESDGRLLEGFVTFEQSGAPRITAELALGWAKLPSRASRYRWRERLGTVRSFARYVATIDPASEVPSKDLLPAARRRVAPYIYAPSEIEALMASARALQPPLRAATFETLIGLLASSGLRLGEALGLDRVDVDLGRGILHVRAGLTEQREAPLHASTTEALRIYARMLDRRWPNLDTAAFFVSRLGARLSKAAVHKTFPQLIHEAGLDGHGHRARPRPHDLRHTFAVSTLVDWHQAGVDIDRQIPLLSTYLGHRDPKSTFWYLQATPELLSFVAERLDGVLDVQP
jgi:integrase/recombinase XerD